MRLLIPHSNNKHLPVHIFLIFIFYIGKIQKIISIIDQLLALTTGTCRTSEELTWHLCQQLFYSSIVYNSYCHYCDFCMKILQKMRSVSHKYVKRTPERGRRVNSKQTQSKTWKGTKDSFRAAFCYVRYPKNANYRMDLNQPTLSCWVGSGQYCNSTELLALINLK